MSRAITTALVAGALLLSPLAARAPASDEGPDRPLRLLYRQPASEWTAALSIGNGRLGGILLDDR